jgi:hypothetical protein
MARIDVTRGPAVWHALRVGTLRFGAEGRVDGRKPDADKPDRALFPATITRPQEA